MNLVDIIAIVFAVLYAFLGWYTGTIRRVLGLIAVYIAMWVATNMGQQGAGIYLQYSPNTPIPDARLYGWLFFFVLLTIVLEGAAMAIHRQIQFAVVALDHFMGLVVALVTAFVVILAVFYMTAGYSKAATNTPSGVQINLRDQLASSKVVLPLVKATGASVLPLLSAALPRDPQAYFAFEGPR
jgi:uncharacterized membrane protein required for colicin V production